MENNIKKEWKTNQSTKINLIGCDTIVNSPSNYFRLDQHPRQVEHDRQSYQPPAYAQDYPRGEDRSSQYSWDPLPRREGEESRIHNYGQNRR
jgi:hypothetical protein